MSECRAFSPSTSALADSGGQTDDSPGSAMYARTSAGDAAERFPRASGVKRLRQTAHKGSKANETGKTDATPR